MSSARSAEESIARLFAIDNDPAIAAFPPRNGLDVQPRSRAQPQNPSMGHIGHNSIETKPGPARRQGPRGRRTSSSRKARDRRAMRTRASDVERARPDTLSWIIE